MHSTRPSAPTLRAHHRNAEREFLDSIRGPAYSARPTDLARASATQRAIDDSRPLRIPVADAVEVPFDDCTAAELSTFFGAFADTQAAAL